MVALGLLQGVAVARGGAGLEGFSFIFLPLCGSTVHKTVCLAVRSIPEGCSLLHIMSRVCSKRRRHAPVIAGERLHKVGTTPPCFDISNTMMKSTKWCQKVKLPILFALAEQILSQPKKDSV